MYYISAATCQWLLLRVQVSLVDTYTQFKRNHLQLYKGKIKYTNPYKNIYIMYLFITILGILVKSVQLCEQQVLTLDYTTAKNHSSPVRNKLKPRPRPKINFWQIAFWIWILAILIQVKSHKLLIFIFPARI